MDLNNYEEKQKLICADIENRLPICTHLNMLCSLRNLLMDNLEKVNSLIEEVDKETFKEHIKECSVWRNKELKIDVKIDSIDWDKEYISWHNVINEYPNGWSEFESFRLNCYPLWGL